MSDNAASDKPVNAVAPRWLRGLHRIEDGLLALLLLALLTLAVSQIALRVFFDTGLLWSEPVSRLLVLWLALLGGLAATREGKHIAIDAIPRLLPPLGRRIAWIIAQCGAALIAGALAWYSVSMIELELEVPTYLVGTLPNWVGMLVLPFGFGLMALRFLLSAFLHDPSASPELAPKLGDLSDGGDRE
ncbi:MAG: TRAP transporter small permease [Lysobacteraceae bacterium]